MKKIFYVLVLVLVLVGAARAEPPPVKDAEGFEPVNGNMMMQRGEFIPADRLVAGAYGFIFAAVVVWVASVAARARRLELEAEALRRKLEQKAS
jgi:hypothetical protein